MIRRISAITADWLEREGVVSSNDHELFSYAIYSLLFGLSPILIAAVLGFVLRMLRESLLMIIPFLLIRKFSGGYHLKSSKVCFISSTALIALALMGVKAIILTNNTVLLTCFVLLSCVNLFALSPIDSEARRLSPAEKKIFRSIAQCLTLLAFIVFSLFAIHGCTAYAAPIGVGILIAASLQIPCLAEAYLHGR